ncbi:hypothetical protein [Capnocytophaga cynodegmi]|nr:hypothetical protein [Capnocytophaga cynodegmi]
MKSIKKNNSQDYHIVKIKNFREVVQYMYYRFSEYYKRKEGLYSSYKFSGFSLLVIIIYFNFLSIIILFYNTYIGNYIDKFLDFPFTLSENKLVGRLLYSIGWFAIFSYLTYLLLGKISYEEIYDKFQKETPKQRKKRKWFIIAYMILSAITFLVLATIKNWDS